MVIQQLFPKQKKKDIQGIIFVYNTLNKPGNIYPLEQQQQLVEKNC